MSTTEHEKPDNLWDILTRDIDPKAIWTILTQEITFGRSGEPPLATLQDFDRKAEQLLELAQRLANERNISLTEALAQLGVSVVDSTHARGREHLLHVLEAEPVHPRHKAQGQAQAQAQSKSKSKSIHNSDRVVKEARQEIDMGRQRPRRRQDRGLLMDAIRETSAVTLVRKLFEQAITSGATDIHIEPTPDLVRIRFRIDGLLTEVTRLDRDLAQELNSRIKILADMDITVKRKPQDGHLTLKLGSDMPRDYSLRISTLPTRHGEKMAIRLVDPSKIFANLKQLGLEQSDLVTIKTLTSKPYGMILVTGPVGSGKTTTLYSCINSINHAGLNVMSIENPIEFDLEGTSQVEVNYEYGLDFVEGLRAILRQDPNVILLGEIRDEETARIAIRAALTGLLVLSTLHTHDAPSAINTLLNFNLPRHLIGSALLGVIAQRLVRKICPHCRKPHTLTEEEQVVIGPRLVGVPQNQLKFYQGAGCAHCFNTGYTGRTGVFEILTVTNEIREMILDGGGERAIREKALEQGMLTLTSDGLRKVLAGVVSVEEFIRVLNF